MLSALPSLVFLAVAPPILLPPLPSSSQVHQVQAPVEVKAIDALLEALRTRTLAPVQPYLSPETRIGDLPAIYTSQILPQLLEKSAPVERAEFVRQSSEGANTRYVYRLTREGKAKEYDFLVAADGRFLEINLVKASLMRIPSEIDEAKLTLPDRIATSFRLVKGLILVMVEINGRRGEFILDTGAPAVRLNRAYFAPPEGDLVLGGGGSRGVNGEIGGTSFHHVERFDWHGLRFGDLDLATLDLSPIEARLGNRRILGLIGASVLRRYALTIDYRFKRLELVKPSSKPAIDAATFPLEIRGHLPTAEFTIGDQKLFLGIDTGAQANLLDPRLESAFGTMLRNRKTSNLLGAEGKIVPSLSGIIPEIRLGAIAFRDGKTVFAPAPQILSKSGGAPLDGLVGYPLLSRYRTTIDYVNATVHFDLRDRR